MQRGQPVVLAHHLMAYFEMFDRDATRFAQAAESADVMPLGSGAMAGVPYDIDREWVAKQLDFSDISRNSMDAVSVRDFIIEFLTASSLAMGHRAGSSWIIINHHESSSLCLLYPSPRARD